MELTPYTNVSVRGNVATQAQAKAKLGKCIPKQYKLTKNNNQITLDQKGTRNQQA